MVMSDQSQELSRRDESRQDMSRRDATNRDMSRYSLTVDTASERFADAGVPRSPRTVMRYCALGHLDCVKIETETSERYLVTPDSVAKRIEELLSIDVSRHDETHRESTTDQRKEESSFRATSDGLDTENLRRENEELKRENLDLKITNRGKDEFIKMIREERAQFVEDIRIQAHRIGELEERLRLPAASSARTSAAEATDRENGHATREATHEVIRDKGASFAQQNETEEVSRVESPRSIHTTLFGEDDEGSRMDVTSSDR